MYSDYNDIIQHANHHNSLINDIWIESDLFDNAKLNNSPNIGIIHWSEQYQVNYVISQ